MSYNYTRVFNPDKLKLPGSADNRKDFGDRRDGRLYLYTEDIILGVNVALATRRPLLVEGPSGCGKSSLAFNVARHLGRRYYEFVVTSRTQASDLLWQFDAVRRLTDSRRPRSGSSASLYPYIEPGILWWVFDRKSAAERGTNSKFEVEQADDPAVYNPPRKGDAEPGSVVLIDEIDKADPDFPNNLLVPLGSGTFSVDEIRHKVSFQGDKPPLIVITSNGQRRLPQAFIRRCVVLTVRALGREELFEIARETFVDADQLLFERVADAMDKLHLTRADRDETNKVSVAEFLDAVRAAIELGVTRNEPYAAALDAIVRITSTKSVERQG